MCAVIGYHNIKFAKKDITTLNKLFIQSKIRGLHATGISVIVGDKNVETVIKPKPADKFISEIDMSSWVGKPVTLIGHCRYSTSDLNYNQPIHYGDISLVHNGVVTQENYDKWEEHFDVKCVGKNDSEILLRLIEKCKRPVVSLPDASMACIMLREKEFSVFRNGKRPLHYVEYGSSVIFASTADILIRTLGSDIQVKDVVAGHVMIFEHGVEKYKWFRHANYNQEDLQSGVDNE